MISKKHVSRQRPFIPKADSEFCPGRMCVFYDTGKKTGIKSYHSGKILSESAPVVVVKMDEWNIHHVHKNKVLLTYEDLSDTSATPTCIFATLLPVESTKWILKLPSADPLDIPVSPVTILRVVDPFPQDGRRRQVIVFKSERSQVLAKLSHEFVFMYQRCNSDPLNISFPQGTYNKDDLG